MKKPLSVIKFLILIVFPVLVLGYKLLGSFPLYRLFYKAERQITTLKPYKKLFIPKTQWLSTSANKIVNEKGEPVILRGVNIGSLNWGYESWHPKAVSYAIKNWHANVVRIRIFPQDFVKDKENFFYQLEKQLIKPARKQGTYVILHTFVADSFDDLPDENTIQMWQAVAQYYKDDQIILYDLIPEPHNTTKEKVVAAYLDLIPLVRKANPRSLIFVTGLGWGREINSYLNDPLPFDNLVYRSNPYNETAEFESLFSKIAFKYPVFLGEFGADGYPPMSQQAVADLINNADQLGLGWAAWIFHSEGCPCLLKDWRTFEPSDWGKLVFEALQKQARAVNLPQLPEAEQGELTVFDDSFENGFFEQGWKINVDLQNQENIYLGEKSLKVEYTQGYSGLGLPTYDVFEASKYSRLQFFFNYAENPPFSIKVNLNDIEDKTIGEVEISNYQQEVERNWYLISLPLTDFGVTNQLISGLAIKEASGSGHKPIYLDEIKFLK